MTDSTQFGPELQKRYLEAAQEATWPIWPTDRFPAEKFTSRLGEIVRVAADATAEVVFTEVVKPLERDKYWADREFPRFLILVGEDRYWMTLSAAASSLEHGFVPARFGNRALDKDGPERKMTADEREKIEDARDTIAENK